VSFGQSEIIGKAFERNNSWRGFSDQIEAINPNKKESKVEKNTTKLAIGLYSSSSAVISN